jgi:tRNA and rRNA cytosine-C5-methylases
MLDAGTLDLPPAERAEAQGLADLVLRRLGQVDALLDTCLERRPKPPVDHVLRVMAAEIALAGRAPHAAVDLAVRQVKRGRTARMAGLVNAVGRTLAAEGPARAAALPPPAMPRWLARRLATDWGTATAEAIRAAHLVPAPVDLTPRDPAEAGRLAEALGAELLPTGSLRLAARPQISALPGHAEGAFWAQDAAAALPARLLGEVAGRRVLDLCAAPGGKTLQLAAAGARVTALDVSEARLARLRENLARTGLSAEMVVADALDWAPETAFDAVLVDAPCSATGRCGVIPISRIAGCRISPR